MENENYLSLLLEKENSEVQKSFDQSFVTETFTHFLAQGVPKSDIIRFFHKAQLTGADPRRDQIFLIPRSVNIKKKVGRDWVDNWVKVGTVVFSYHFVEAQAQRTKEYQGYNLTTGVAKYFNPIEGKEVDMLKCVCTVRRAGHEYSFVAWWDEYVQSGQYGVNAQWKSKPHLMLEKCAKAGALRSAFPEWLSGIYSEEEMGSIEKSEDNAIEAEFNRKEIVRDMIEKEENIKKIQERGNDQELIDIKINSISKIMGEITKGFNVVKKAESVKHFLGVDNFTELKKMNLGDIDKKLEQLEKDFKENPKIKSYRDSILELKKDIKVLDPIQKPIKEMKNHTFTI